MQPRTLAILVVILPLLASNSAYLLSAYEGSVPWCMPYIDGCTTISNAGRSGDTIFLYRILVFVYGVLLTGFWLYAKHWSDVLVGHATKVAQVIFWLGLIGSIGLLVYIDYLGATGETHRLLRRIGAALYFTMTPLAQFLMLWHHYKILRKKPAKFSINAKVLRYQLFIAIVILIIVAISVLLALTGNDTYERENIVEWNISLLVTLYFAGMIFLWKDYRHVSSIGGDKK